MLFNNKLLAVSQACGYSYGYHLLIVSTWTQYVYVT